MNSVRRGGVNVFDYMLTFDTTQRISVMKNDLKPIKEKDLSKYRDRLISTTLLFDESYELKIEN